jgi:DNA-binding transcriptional MocR family regulator
VGRTYDISAHRNASFSWLKLPQHKRAEPIIASLAERGVAVASPNPYAVGPSSPNALRLAFGEISEEGLRSSLEIIRSALDVA